MNERPAYWGVGLGLGLALAGGFVVADAYRGALNPFWFMLYPGLIVTGIGFVVALAGLGKGLSWALDTSDELAARREQRRPALPVLESLEPILDESPDTETEHIHNWEVALLHAIMYAETYGWTFDSLGPTGINIMERAAWDAITDYLRDCGRLVKKDRSRTRYTEHWDGPKLRDEIRRHDLPLPLPLGSAPNVHAPRCTESVLAQMALPAQKKTAARPEVIDIPPSREVHSP